MDNNIKKEPKNKSKTFLRLIKYMKQEKWLFIFGIIALLLSLITMISTSLLTGPIAENLQNKNIEGVKRSIYSLATVIFLTAFLTFVGNTLFAILSQKVSYRLRDKLFNHIQTLSIGFFDKYKPGNIVSLFTHDIEMINIAFDQCISKTIISILQIIITIIILFKINAILTIITVTVLLVYIIAMKILGTKEKVLRKRENENKAILTAYSEETVSNLPIIKSYNMQDETNERFSEISDKTQKSSVKANRVAMFMNMSGQGFGFLINSIAIFLGLLLYTKNILDISNLIIYINLTSSLALPIQNVSLYLSMIYAAIAGGERIFEIMDLEPEIDEGNITIAEKDNIKYWNDNGKLTKAEGNVEFKKVYFDYDETQKEKENMILKDISFTASNKQTIALVGSTGAGKTTITNLIDRFYEISDGNILIDNIPIEKIEKNALREIITVVLQEPSIFTGTVMENIKKGNLNADRDDIIKSSKLTNADVVISKLPNGYDTKISSEDISLSKGEKQFISIARAAVSKPLILMLDEATSSIDSVTEKLVQKGFENLMNECTTIVIAHRLSTIRNADMILVIEDGRIIERGTHEELLDNKGKYYNLNMGVEVLD